MTAGDAMVATVWARSIQPRVGGDTGNVHMVFETNGNPYTKSMNVALQFGADWQKFQFPFRAVVSHPAAGAHVNFWLGYGVQTFQIAGISVTDLGPGNPAGYPQVTYEGRDANAPWRTAANDRIDQYRKGDLAVSVVDASGRPVNGATVRAAQQKSAFDFGTRRRRRASARRPVGWDHRQRHGEVPGRHPVAVQHDLAGQQPEVESLGEPDRAGHADLPRVAVGARARHDHPRRTTLVWPSFGNMPTDVASLANNPDALRTRVRDHVTDEASALNGIADEIDVVNEPYSEHAVQDRLGQQEIHAWFELAHQAAPDARLALNDYGILENGGGEGRHRDYDYNLLASMKAAGTPVDVVGMESHFNGLQLTPPDQLMSIVDKFAALGVKVGITEFDVATDDLQLQADYTRDFMTAMFSNPNVTEIANFGIWAKNIYNPLVALYNADWSAKPNALVWQDLINRQWHTDVTGGTNNKGKFTVRGFQGDYLVTVTVGGISKQVKVSMPTTAGASVTVIADGIATSPATIPVNPIGDGDFETATKGWNPLGTGPATTTDAHSGTGALALAQGSGVTQTVYGLTNATSYLLSGWAKLSGPGTQCYIGVRGGATANKPTFQYELSYADERSYTQKLLAFTPPTGTTWTQTFVWSNPNPTGATCAADDIRITPTSGTPPPAQAPPAITPYLPTPSTLLNGTMENQANTNGWYCLGSCVLKNASTTPHTGTGVLSVTARQAAFAGPAQGVALPSNGGLYNSSAWLRLAEPGTDTGMVSLKLTTSTGTNTFRFGTATITGDGWTRVGASNVKVAWSGTLTKAEWWISTATGAANLLVDDASFAPMAGTVTGRDLMINGDVGAGRRQLVLLRPLRRAGRHRSGARRCHRDPDHQPDGELHRAGRGRRGDQRRTVQDIGVGADGRRIRRHHRPGKAQAHHVRRHRGDHTDGLRAGDGRRLDPTERQQHPGELDRHAGQGRMVDQHHDRCGRLLRRRRRAATGRGRTDRVQPGATHSRMRGEQPQQDLHRVLRLLQREQLLPPGTGGQFQHVQPRRGGSWPDPDFLPYQRPKRVAVIWDGTPLTWQLNGVGRRRRRTRPPADHANAVGGGHRRPRHPIEGNGPPGRAN